MSRSVRVPGLVLMVTKRAPQVAVEAARHGAFESVRTGAIEAALEGIVTVDDQQRIVMINPAAERMFGYTARELLGSDVSRLIPVRLRESHARHAREFDRSGATELPRRARTDMIGLRANGQEFPLEAAVSRVDAVDTLSPQRFFTVLLRDVSEDRARDESLASATRRLQAMFELAPVAIWITEGDDIVFANRASAELFNAPDSAALIGRSIYSLLDPSSHDEVRRRVAQALARDDTAAVVRERILGLAGPGREVEIAVAGLPDHGATAVQMVITDVTNQRREHLALERSERELQRLSASLVNAREEERRRIARELHDELGQWLTVLKMELDALPTAGDPQTLSARVARLIEMVDEIVHSVRRIAMDLRPMMLDDLGLNAAIEWLARDSARRMNVKITLQLDDDDPCVSASAAIALYRMTQEALTNIARHARAHAVHIGLTQVLPWVTLTVADDGIGLPPDSQWRAEAQGLIGIRERVRMFGGQIELGNRPSGGTLLTIRLPASAAPQDP